MFGGHSSRLTQGSWKSRNLFKGLVKEIVAKINSHGEESKSEEVPKTLASIQENSE